MNLYNDIVYGDKEKDFVNVVVEIPKHSFNKYEYDEDAGYFKLDRTLYHSMHYPFEYGSIPQTKANDGDPVDALILMSHPTFPGCVIKCRPIGMIVSSDQDGEDNKVICVPVTKVDPRWEHVKTVQDIPEHTQKELLLFFKEYKKLEAEKYDKVVIHGFADLEDVWKLIEVSGQRHKAERS